MASEAGPIRLVGTLALSGLISGVLIVGAYLATLPRIRRNQAEALLRAVDGVLSLDPAHSSKRAFVLRGQALVAFEGDLAAGLPAEEAVYAGYDEGGRLVGFAVPASTPGFQDTIALIYGYDPVGDRAIGLQVLESKETPGLGDKILKDQGFLGQFRDLSLSEELVGVKGARARPCQVDVISGATISSKAVLRAVNEAHSRWAALLQAAARGEKS